MRWCLSNGRFPVRALCIVFSLVLSARVPASDMGLAAVSLVEETSYRHFLDDLLYTHTGDDRGYGPEHDLARDNIAAQFTSFGLTVTLEPVPYGGGGYYNVVGRKVGTVYPDQFFIVGAHYDSVSNPGADDNASGVALVLEAARVLKDFPAAYSIVFVAFDREEQGLHGSYEYVDAHITDDIVGMISADMVSYNTYGANRADIFGQAASSAHKQAVADAVAAYGNGLTATNSGPSGGSDHVPFEAAGFPACLLIENWGNPYYHTQLDSVDTANYIDYNYATNMTRSVVGFLVDNAEVQVTLHHGDFNDDTFVDMTDYNMFVQCYTGPDNGPIPVECEQGDFDYDQDIDCDDWFRFLAVWTDPGDPPVLPQCIIVDPLVAPWPFSSTTNRYVSFDPNNAGIVVAYEIELADSTIYPEAAGIYGWVSQPNQDGVSEFVDTPYYTDAWPATIIVGDCEIVPASTYFIRGTIDGALFSEPLVRATTAPPAPKHWADICGKFDGTWWAAPNGVVNFDDVYGAIKAYQKLPLAPPFFWADVEPETPNRVVNINDVYQIILAFQGNEYPFTNPDFCP